MLKPLLRTLGLLLLISSFSVYAFPEEDVPFPPGAPNVTLPSTDTDGNYPIFWTTFGATSYTLYEFSSSAGYYISIYSGPLTSRNITGKADGTYSYYVRACNSYGCANSSIKSIVVSSAPVAPSVPGTPTSTSFNSVPYTISWSTSTGVLTEYVLQERVNNSGSWTTVHSQTTTRQKTYSTKSPNTYDYRVKACNGTSCSNYSAISNDVTIANLNPPTLSSSYTSGKASLTLSWVKASGSNPDTYYIQESSDGVTWDTSLNAGSNTSKLFSSLLPGSHYFQVKACISGNCGSWSSSHVVSITAPSLCQ